MNDFSKIAYSDLRLEARWGRLPKTVGFEKEISRMDRALSRQLQHNVALVAPSGCGKTALVYGWAKAAAAGKIFGKKKIVLLSAGTLQKIGQLPQNSLSAYQEAFLSLENCVLIIDSFGEMIYQSLGSLQNWNTLLKPLFFKEGLNLILSMQPEELRWLEENKSHFLSHFEILKLETQNQEHQLQILKQAVAGLGLAPGQVPKIQDGALELILKLCSRFPILGQLPKSAIGLLDEAAAEIRAARRLAAEQQ